MRLRLREDALTALLSSDVQTRMEVEPILEILSLGFEITSFAGIEPGLWVSTIRGDPDIGSDFGLGSEYVLIGNASTIEFQPRFLAIEPAAAVLDRIDPSVRFLVSSDPLAEAASSAWGAARRTSVVLLRPGSFGTTGSEPARRELLLQALSACLWRRDFFSETEPVRAPDEFYGRGGELSHVLAIASAGGVAAILGLRKVGKSSMLAKVDEALRVNGDGAAATACLSAGSARLRNGRWWNALLDVVEQWREVLRKRVADANATFEIRAPHLQELVAKKVIDAHRLENAFEKDVASLIRTIRALARVLGQQSARLILAIDDCDRIYPHLAGAGHWRTDFFFFWNTLQATRQRLESCSQLVVVLASGDPSGVEQGALLGEPNPLFETTKIYLRPMTSADAGVLLGSIGRRMGLRFDDAAIHRAYALVGGHPLLLRQLGSAVHLATIGRPNVTVVTEAVVGRAYRKYRREFHNRALWILEYFGKVAPDESRLLRDIALGGELAYSDAWGGDAFRETYACHLEEYGLVHFEGEHPEVSFDLLREALQTPPTSELAEQKRVLKDLVDGLESGLRLRLSVDLAREQLAAEAVHAVVVAIPSEAKNRPMDRNALLELGAREGLHALLEALNWGDYEILIDKFYDRITWSDEPSERAVRLDRIKLVFRQAHLVRHNNDRELGLLIRAEGFAAVCGRVSEIRRMLSS